MSHSLLALAFPAPGGAKKVALAGAIFATIGGVFVKIHRPAVNLADPRT